MRSRRKRTNLNFSFDGAADREKKSRFDGSRVKPCELNLSFLPLAFSLHEYKLTHASSIKMLLLLVWHSSSSKSSCSSNSSSNSRSNHFSAPLGEVCRGINTRKRKSLHSLLREREYPRYTYYVFRRGKRMN